MSNQKTATKRVFPEGLLGKKLGMTQLFAENGEAIPVTVIQVGPCYVLSTKDQQRDGYSAVQFGFEPTKMTQVSKAEAGHFAKAGLGAFAHVKEVRCDVDKLGWGSLGKEVVVGDIFTIGERVDVSGTSIGRGFAGVVKRHRVGGQPPTRGTHEYRRHIGSVGCRKWPGRIHPGKRMPGHMGNAAVTVQNLEVVGVSVEDNVMMVRGGVPGSDGGLLLIRKAMKGYKTTAKAA